MKHLIKNPRDFWAGVMFLAVGASFAGIALTYKLGTAARMGPGFFPSSSGSSWRYWALRSSFPPCA